MNMYSLKVKDAQGNIVDMKDYQGKVLLIVNTATGCGFTPQYDGLQNLYDKYKNQGFEILDFPCNQFGNQAPGTEEEIVNFCKINFSTTFKQFSKVDVNGDKEDPLFTYLKSQKSGLMGSAIKWNFTKFLVDRNGRVIERYAPATAPEKIEDKIKELI
ncbi:glutathione peroxidase [Alloiococcus sp. CFN-8]|uniref:glutathione peroxidase n=1 Tax=Alloiococcus sp. CFN-8 TaxID=3416081 RepID=UPI003CF6E273